MAEEAKGQKFSFQDGGRLGARIGNQGATQTQGSTQSTGASDTSGVQSSGVFLPGISGVNNKVDNVVKSIQSGKIQTNVQLPGITDKTPTYPNATMTAMTPDEIDEMDKIAKKNGTYRESWNDIIHDEMLSNEYKQLLKQGVIQTWNDVRKYSYRKGAELVDYVTKHPYEALGKYGGMGGPFNIWGKLADKVIVDNNPVVKSAGNIASNKMWQGYYKYEDKINKNFEKWVDKNISKTLAEEYQNSGGIWESIKNWDTDNIKYGLVQGFSTSILPMTPGIIAGIVTKNPYITAGVAFGSTAPIEDQEAYEEAIKEGATREQATEIGKYAGVINGALETVGEFLQIKGLLKPLKKNITKEITKKTGRQIIARGLKEYAQGVGSEALTEGTQEFVTNALIKTINENKDLFEGVLDSIIVGGALSAGPSTLGAGGKVMQDVQNNEIIDQKTDLEALDYVLEGEKRKAQRIEQQKEKMRQRANEKFQAQAGENAGLSDTNDYTEGRNVGGSKPASETTTEESVNTLDEGNVESDGSTFFSTDENGDYVVYDDGKGEQKIYAGSNSVTENGTKKSQFTELSDKTPYDPELEEYSKNFQRLVEKLSDPNVKGQDFVVIGRTEKGKEVRLSKQALKHIIEDHGKINVNTLLKAINKPSKQRWETKTDGKNRPYIVLDLGSKNKEFLVGLAPDSWTKNEDTAEYYTVTTSREAGAPKTPARDTRFQLKYEEEGYNPGVAGKNEKNISGKEGINLRNKLNKKTVKELAEKYGIKVEVIEGMIEILENGKRKGYAYGKYIDQLLTLSEQIKESTAPHELLHAIFDMIDPETKAYLISQVMKSEGWSASKAEERLADSFSNFFRTGKIEGAPKSTWGKIKIFFKRVRSFINGMGKWRNQLDEIFTDIIESEGIEDLQGKIDRNERINKAKERMRERFKQYQKNAEKMQKKEEKQATKNGKIKYQRVYHGSQHDFDKFNHIHSGEGEGRQAHGWGHYVAVDPNTARNYASQRRKWNEFSYKGKDWHDIIVGTSYKDYQQVKNLVSHMLGYDLSFEQAKKERIDIIEEDIKNYEEWLKDDDLKEMHKIYRNNLETRKKDLEETKAIKKSDFEGIDRNFYEVEIPDSEKAGTPTGSNYLEEKKNFTKRQIDNFKKILENYNLPYTNKWLNEGHIQDGEDLYSALSEDFNSDAGASKFLERLGYDGIHYFGGVDGEAYVIFDDDNMDIQEHEKYQKMDSDQKDNDGRTLSNGQAEYFENSIARVDESLDKPLVRVYHTTTNMIIPFTEFNPVGTDGYRFGKDVVNYYTDDEDMSGSYAHQKYKKYTGTAKLYTRADVDKFIEDINNGDYYNYVNKEKLNYEIREVGPEDGLGRDAKYGIYQKRDEKKLARDRKIYDELTPIQKEVVDGINKYGGLDYYFEEEYQKDWQNKSFEEKMKLREKEQELDKAKEDLYNIIAEKSDWNEFFEQFKADVKKGKWTGFSYKSEKDLIRKIEEDVKYKINGASNWMYEGYVNLTNPFVVDAEGRNWNTVRVESKYLNETKETWRGLSQSDKDRITNVVKNAKEEFDAGKKEKEWNWFDYSEENPDLGMAIGEVFPEEFLIDVADQERAGDGVIENMVNAILNGMSDNDIAKAIGSGDGAETTNDVVKSVLRQNKNGETNYDGIIIKNVIDYGGKSSEKPAPHNLYITFASNQFKSIYNENPTADDDIRYQRVYHGSPAEFDKFDSSHMGEGEGAQAHGWGHYVAVDENTGRRYADMRHYNYEVEIDGKTITNEEDLWDVPYFERELYRNIFQRFAMHDYGTFEEDLKDVIDRQRKDYEEVIQYYENLIANPEKPLVGFEDVDMDQVTAERKKQLEGYVDALDKLEELTPEDIKVRETGKKRNLYEVEIPDRVEKDTPTGVNYLDEDMWISTKEAQKFEDAMKGKTDKYVPDFVGEIVRLAKDTKLTGKKLYNELVQFLGDGKRASNMLKAIGYDGIHYFGGRDGEAYVIFDDNDLEIKNHEKYQKTEYEYDENGNPKRIKFGDNSEFDPSIFGENTREEQIEEDKENEKGNPFYNAWMRYNNQNYKDDQKTFEEFMKGLSDRADKEQEIYDEKMRSLSDAQNDPKLLELQLKAIKLMEKEQNVGKKFGKNVSKEVRDRQQAEVEKERENLVKEIFDYMYPGLKFEDATYEDNQRAFEKEAEWEMLGKEDIENKLKLYKKDKNGNREAKEIKIENPDIKLEKLLSAGKFDEIFEPTDRVIEWKTPEGQKGRIDKAKDPKKFKSVMEKINSGKTKTKVELKDVTNEVRALERYKENEKAEKERRKKEKQEEFAKKKQEEYKRMVRMKAFQKLVDMQRFEKYPFLTEEEIKNRYGFSDQEWKTITEQEEIKLPKKWGEKAISDFNKAVDDQVKALIEGLNWQNRMKQKEAEKNLGEIGEIDLDVLLGKDEEKGAREVEEFEKLAKEGKEETGGEKIEEGKTAWEKDMDKKNEKAKKQAEKLTNKWKEDVNDMFRKAEEKRNERYANKEEKVIDEVKTVEEVKEITKESRWKRTKKFWKDTTIQDLIQPISSRIEKISPRIYLELMRFEQRVAVKTNTRMKQVEDFVKKMAEIRSKNKKDYLNITLHLLNGNVGTANKMLEKYGTSIPRQVLDEIWADAEDVGYTMNYEGFYYPRKVKDVQDFLDRFAKTENKDIQGEIDKIVKKKEEQARKRGEEFTPQMKADLINQLLMEGEVEGISLGSGHMKQRKVDSITKNMLEFYEDPVDALLQYITGMTEAIEKARFLGQGTRGEIKTLGEFIADEGIQGWDAEELRKLLLARFNYAPMSKGVAGLKNIANIIHLGSPSSALSQLADISFSLIENGLTNIVQGLAGKYNLDLDALGVTNRGEELKSQGKNETAMDKIQRFTFKMTGFNMMDQFGKKTLVVSTLNKLIKYAKNNDPQLRKDLSRRFDDPKMIDGVIKDLKAGRMSENVNLFLFTKLADVQPLTRMQMPKIYLTSGNGRIFYQFKTFAVKQLDYLIQKGKRDLKTKGTAKGLRSIVAMMGIIMLCGAGTDELKDFSMGRKYSSWIWRMINDDWSVAMLSDRFWDNLLKLTGLTKYSIYQARTQGIKSTVEDLFFSLSSLDVLTYPMQDIQDAFSEDGLDFSQASSWQLIPIVGKYGYWWAGAGQTKQQKKLDKENKKSEKEKTTSDRKDKYSDRKKESDRKEIKDKYSDRK